VYNNYTILFALHCIAIGLRKLCTHITIKIKLINSMMAGQTSAMLMITESLTRFPE